MTKEQQALAVLLEALAKLDRPEKHVLQRNSRILCGGKSYKIGFSPCELAARRDYVVGENCTAYEAQRRVAVKRAARAYAAVSEPVPTEKVRVPGEIVIEGDIIEDLGGNKMRVVRVADDGVIEAVRL